MTETGRPNQKLRTRKALLQAAAQLMRGGGRPSLEEIAEEALVSRATAYRYFPSVEALLAEAALDIALPEAGDLFGPQDALEDPAARLERVDAAFDAMMADNEAALRLFLANALQQSVMGDAEPGTPLRQNRRSPLIAAALSPGRDAFDPEGLDLLQKAMALIVGTEARLVFKDVLQLDDAEARRVKRWAIRALVAAARRNREDGTLTPTA